MYSCIVILLPLHGGRLSTMASFVCPKVALVERFDCSQLDRLLSEGISSVIFEFEVLHGPTRLCYKYCQGKYKDLKFFFRASIRDPFPMVQYYVISPLHVTFVLIKKVNKMNERFVTYQDQSRLLALVFSLFKAQQATW